MGALQSRVMGSFSFGLVKRDERPAAMHVSRRSRIDNNICITVHTLYMQMQNGMMMNGKPTIPSCNSDLVLYDTWIYTRTLVPPLVGSDAGNRATFLCTVPLLLVFSCTFHYVLVYSDIAMQHVIGKLQTGRFLASQTAAIATDFSRLSIRDPGYGALIHMPAAWRNGMCLVRGYG